MSLTKVNVGTPFRDALKADTWNAFIDAAVDTKKRAEGRERHISAGRERPANTVLVQNTTGGDLDALSVVAPSAPITTPTELLEEFQSRSGWVVVTPASSHFGIFFVTAESIPNNEFGLAYCSGVVPVFTEMPHAILLRADIDAGTATKLECCLNGSAQVIYRESGAGDRWAAVRLGNPQDVVAVGKTNANPHAINTQGQVSIWQNGSDTGYDLEGVWLDWAHGGEAISQNKQVVVQWFSAERRWRITAAECET